MPTTREQPPLAADTAPASSLAQFAVALARNAVPVRGFFGQD